MIKVHTLVVGPLAVNCHILWCPETTEAVVVDPGDEADKISHKIESLKLKPTLIINTHGHLDHIGANAPLVKEYNCPLAVGLEDAEMLPDPQLNLSAIWGSPVISPVPDRLLADGDEISFGSCRLKVIATPGHTEGGICLFGHGLLVAGDTLFKESIGRSDLPGGNHDQLVNSIRTRIFSLPDPTRVLTGHGPETVIDFEKKNNPWLRG